MGHIGHRHGKMRASEGARRRCLCYLYSVNVLRDLPAWRRNGGVNPRSSVWQPQLTAILGNAACGLSTSFRANGASANSRALRGSIPDKSLKLNRLRHDEMVKYCPLVGTTSECARARTEWLARQMAPATYMTLIWLSSVNWTERYRLSVVESFDQPALSGVRDFQVRLVGGTAF